MWRKAALYGAIAALCFLPWAIYAHVNKPTPAERAAHGGAVVYDYVDQLSMRWAGTPEFGRVTLAELPRRIRTNVVDMFARDVGGILVPAFFRGANESGEEVIALGPATDLSAASMGAARETVVISLLLSAIALVGFVRTVRERVTVAEVLMPIALSVVALWPFWSFRFVLPLAPFLFFYFVSGVQVLAPFATRVVLLTLIGLNLYDHAGYLARAQNPERFGPIDWVSQARDVDSELAWIKNSHIGEEGIIATTNPALVYLTTGRKSIACDHPTVAWSGWKARGVRYIAVLFPLELPTTGYGAYRVLYHDVGGRLWVIEI
jgi:hypothetical protein